jgi:hypothetical protein
VLLYCAAISDEVHFRVGTNPASVRSARYYSGLFMKARVTPTPIVNVILNLSKDLGVAQRRSFDFAQDDMK